MPSTPSQLAAIILAAGTSTRMGDVNKLLLPLNGQPIIRRVVRTVTEAPVRDVLVVTGHEAVRVREACTGIEAATFVQNDAYATGMASSIRTGVAATLADATGFLIVLGDLPLLSPDTLAQLRTAFTSATSDAIVCPTTDERRGHPVLFGAPYREALLQLEGDTGARPILHAHADRIIDVPVSDPGIFRDVDTPDAYNALRDAE